MRHFCRQVMVSFFVDISVKAVVDRDDKHVAVNSKADRNASVAGQGVGCCGIGIFQKIAEQCGKLRIGETGGWNRCGGNVHPDLIFLTKPAVMMQEHVHDRKIGIRRSGKMVDLTDVVGQIFDELLCVPFHCIALQNDEVLAEIVPHPSCFFGIFDHILIIRLLQLELAGCLLQLLLRFKPLLLSGENLKEYKIDHKRTQDQSDVKIQDGPVVNSSVRHREKFKYQYQKENKCELTELAVFFWIQKIAKRNKFVVQEK